MTNYEAALVAIHAEISGRNSEMGDKILDALAMILRELRGMREYGLETWQSRDD
jgi:hypothetical protein